MFVEIFARFIAITGFGLSGLLMLFLMLDEIFGWTESVGVDSEEWVRHVIVLYCLLTLFITSILSLILSNVYYTGAEEK